MIPLHELRIGNWVMSDTAGPYHQISSGADIDCAQGYTLIPISDELLTDCGFQFDNYFKLWQKNKAVAGTGPDMEMDPDFWILDFSHQRIGVELKSLHQLQNVYYFLKGRELAIDQQVWNNRYEERAKAYTV